MSWTKRQFVDKAFAEIGLAAYAFDLGPEQQDDALRTLDSMMASWNALGIRLGYPLPANPQDSSLSEETQVPDSANEAIYTNLAIKIAPSFGKTVMPDTKAAARSAYNTLLARAAIPPEQQLPGSMPLGAGNKPWRLYDNPFVRRPIDPVQAGPDGPIDLY